MASRPPTRAIRRPSAALLAGCTLLLFLVWSNSFVAIGYLLGRESAPARFDWASLTLARFLPAALLAGLYCGIVRRAESVALLRFHGGRLFACGLLGVPAYNFALYYGQQHGVPAPVASLTTALAPLFLMLLGAALFRERLTARRIAGFAVALAGLAVIASAPARGGAGSYGKLVVVTALAPLAWSFYSVLGKRAAAGSPFLWTLWTLVLGTLPLTPLLAFGTGARLVSLDASGWSALLFLSFGCTLFGFSAWNWLLRNLPASTAGMTVFLNPPLTTLSKLALASAFPASFAFHVLPREWAGGAIVLSGLAIALARRQRFSSTDTRRPSGATGD